MELKIPSGTASDSILRIKGKGMPDLRYPKRTGEVYIRVKIDVPKHPGMREKKAIKKLLELQGERSLFDG